MPAAVRQHAGGGRAPAEAALESGGDLAPRRQRTPEVAQHRGAGSLLDVNREAIPAGRHGQPWRLARETGVAPAAPPGHGHPAPVATLDPAAAAHKPGRSEEHTSELQSLA